MMVCWKCETHLPDDAIFCHRCGMRQGKNQRGATRRANGTGTAYFYRGAWVAEVTKGYRRKNGALRRASAKKSGFATKEDALAYIPILQERPMREKNISWSKLYSLWLPTHRAGQETMNCYKSASKYFYDIAYLKLKDIEIEDLQDCIDNCPKGRRTRENMKALCSLMYKYAIPRGYANLNFAQYLIISGDSGKARSGFSVKQVEAIKETIGVIPFAEYVYCMCYLGFRLSEFLALELKNYISTENALVGGAKTKAGKNRVVTISPKIQPYIDRLVEGRTSGALFCNKDGKQWDSGQFRRTVFYPTLEAAGIENPIQDGRHLYSTHACRHTFATLMKMVSAPDKDKMQLIGHASPEMLRFYQDVDFSDLRKITDNL